MVPPYMADTPNTRADLASYYNEVTRFDVFVGRVLDELRTQGVLDNTLVVVMADNGRPFPRAKTRLHDPGMKTPFVVSWPAGIPSPGGSRAALISAIDIAPTALDLAGIPRPETMQGISFRPALASDDPVRRFAFSEHNWHDYQAHGRAVRSAEGWIYIRNARPERGWIGPADSVGSPTHRDLQRLLDEGRLTAAQADVLLEPRPAEELYFTPEDPRQLNDRVGDPDAAATLAELRRLMDRWQEETGDSAHVDFSPDYFDRVTGYIDQATGKRVQDVRTMRYGTAPGADRGAERINQPGPR